MVSQELSPNFHHHPHCLCSSWRGLVRGWRKYPRLICSSHRISIPCWSRHWRRVSRWICSMLGSYRGTEEWASKPVVYYVYKRHDRLGFRRRSLHSISHGGHLYFRPLARCMETFFGAGCCSPIAPVIPSYQTRRAGRVQEREHEIRQDAVPACPPLLLAKIVSPRLLQP